MSSRKLYQTRNSEKSRKTKEVGTQTYKKEAMQNKKNQKILPKNITKKNYFLCFFAYFYSFFWAFFACFC